MLDLFLTIAPTSTPIIPTYHLITYLPKHVSEYIFMNLHPLYPGVMGVGVMGVGVMGVGVMCVGVIGVGEMGIENCKISWKITAFFSINNF